MAKITMTMMNSLPSLLFVFLIVSSTTIVGSDSPFIVAYKKATLNRLKSSAEKVSVSIDIYNQGSALIIEYNTSQVFLASLESISFKREKGVEGCRRNHYRSSDPSFNRTWNRGSTHKIEAGNEACRRIFSGRVRVAVRLRPQNAEEMVADADFADCVELQQRFEF
ncbi:hypothetical protein L2E82_49021 [Cichorium intybus]|uniref:Uncharacterized protein n=1 Tax=Cichorium intybus TaxID=13427 RepID=A0ACB8YZ57_CICIN|nr:hypothetical protein L2E82_49021 [Cichorium intybus]